MNQRNSITESAGISKKNTGKGFRQIGKKLPCIGGGINQIDGIGKGWKIVDLKPRDFFS